MRAQLLCLAFLACATTCSASAQTPEEAIRGLIKSGELQEMLGNPSKAAGKKYRTIIDGLNARVKTMAAEIAAAKPRADEEASSRRDIVQDPTYAATQCTAFKTAFQAALATNYPAGCGFGGNLTTQADKAKFCATTGTASNSTCGSTGFYAVVSDLYNKYQGTLGDGCTLERNSNTDQLRQLNAEQALLSVSGLAAISCERDGAGFCEDVLSNLDSYNGTFASFDGAMCTPCFYSTFARYSKLASTDPLGVQSSVAQSLAGLSDLGLFCSTDFLTGATCADSFTKIMETLQPAGQNAQTEQGAEQMMQTLLDALCQNACFKRLILRLSLFNPLGAMDGSMSEAQAGQGNQFDALFGNNMENIFYNMCVKAQDGKYCFENFMGAINTNGQEQDTITTRLEASCGGSISAATCQTGCQDTINQAVDQFGCCGSALLDNLGAEAGVHNTLAERCEMNLPGSCVSEFFSLPTCIQIPNLPFDFYQQFPANIDMGVARSAASIFAIRSGRVGVSTSTAYAVGNAQATQICLTAHFEDRATADAYRTRLTNVNVVSTPFPLPDLITLPANAKLDNTQLSYVGTFTNTGSITSVSNNQRFVQTTVRFASTVAAFEANNGQNRLRVRRAFAKVAGVPLFRVTVTGYREVGRGELDRRQSGTLEVDVVTEFESVAAASVGQKQMDRAQIAQAFTAEGLPAPTAAPTVTIQESSGSTLGTSFLAAVLAAVAALVLM